MANIMQKWFKKFIRAEEGSVIAMSAIGVLMLIIAVFFSIDWGRNYGNQAKLEAALTTCTKYATKEYLWYKIRNTTGSFDRPGALIIPDASISETAALGALQGWVQTCLRDQGRSNELNTANVTNVRVYAPTNTGKQILEFTAEVTCEKTFAGSCTALEALSASTLPLFDTGFPPTSEIGDIAAEVVWSLDERSEQNLGTDINNILTNVQNALSALNITDPNAIQMGMQIGNMPHDLPEALSNNKNRMGWSGVRYDSDPNIATVTLGAYGEADESRKWPYYAEFYGQHTRRCGADPVWTYELEADGTCWERQSHDCGYHSGDTNSNNCCANRSDYVAGTASRCDSCPGGCVWSGAGTSCVNPGDGSPCGNMSEKWCCEIEGDQTIYRGAWSAACPKSAMSTNATYRNPRNADLIKFNAYMIEDFEGDSVSNMNDVVLEGRVVQKGTNYANHQTEELGPLLVKNTDRNFLWACDETYFSNGQYGPPYGRGTGNSARFLTNDDGSPSNVALNPDIAGIPGGGSSSACRVPEPPANSVDTYLVEFKRINQINGNRCQNNDGECNIPVGRYWVTATVTGLEDEKSPSGPPPTAGGLRNQTPAPSPGWATEGTYPGGSWAVNNAAGFQNQECPKDAGGNYKRNAAPFVPYSSGARIKVGQLPAESLSMSDFYTEKYRDTNGNPVMIPFDLFDEDMLNNEQFYVYSTDSLNDDPAWPPSLWCQNAYLDGGIHPIHDEAWWCTGPDPYGFEDLWMGISPYGGGVYHGIARFSGRTFGAPSGQFGQEHPVGYSNCWNAPGELECITGLWDQYDRLATPVIDISSVRSANPGSGANWWQVDHNIPMGLGNFTAIMNKMQQGYAQYAIFEPHANNQGSLIEAGLDALKRQAPAGSLQTLIWVGSCPENDSYTDDRMQGTPVHWWATGNRWSSGPGAVRQSSMDLWNMNDGFSGNKVRTDTASAFQTVAGQVDYMVVITEASCMPDFAVGGGGPAGGDPFCTENCAIGWTPPGWTRPMTPEDCAAEMLCGLYINAKRDEVEVY